MAWCEGEGRPRANQAAGARSDGAVLRVPSLAPVEEEELGPIPSHDEVVVRSKLKDGLVGGGGRKLVGHRRVVEMFALQRGRHC